VTSIDSSPGVSVSEARRRLARAFAAASLDSPELDARLLVSHALGLDHAALVAAADRPLDALEQASIAALADRRLKREPVSRILGTKEFWSLPLRVNPAVLVPRPETEALVETALHLLDAEDRRGVAVRIADLGTGSGAVLIALLHELAAASGVGTDRSAAALAVAAANAEHLGMGGRARFVACDFGRALAGAFDLIVSNPPYIASSAIPELAPEVRDHDPALALDGGQDGLAAYRAIAADAERLLAPGGHLLLELGAGLAQSVTALFARPSFVVSAPRTDLAGTPRVLHVLCGHSRRPTLGEGAKSAWIGDRNPLGCAHGIGPRRW
jgi:release factor glutamine methyltransferase